MVHLLYACVADRAVNCPLGSDDIASLTRFKYYYVGGLALETVDYGVILEFISVSEGVLVVELLWYEARVS